MERRVGQKLPKLQLPGIRRTLLAFLAFVYLFVGLAHPFVCTDEAFASTFAADSAVPSGDNSDEPDSQKLPVVAGHCHIAAPVLMPTLVAEAGRSTCPVKLSFVEPKLQFEDHPRLDTPPPKQLT